MGKGCFSRRGWLRAVTGLPVLALRGQTPTARVALARCADYDRQRMRDVLARMFDQLGGLGRLLAGKTVTLKLNLTGSPALRLRGLPPSLTHYSQPVMVGVMVSLLGEAGARRIRLTESFQHLPLEEMMLEAGWDVRAIARAAAEVEFVNTNFLGASKSYRRFRVPHGGYIFPAFDLHPAYEETDVLISMAKLKEHATCGITLATKNLFGMTPASIYGDDAGAEEPNEKPQQGRLDICHYGKRQPSRSAPPELDPASPRSPEYRMPRISIDVAAARPPELSVIDGISTMTRGEGPWIRGGRRVEPGVVIAGLNCVATDAVASAVMGFDPRAPRGAPPFEKCDNMLLLAEQAGLGTADLSKIEITGERISDAKFDFRGPAAALSAEPVRKG